MAQDARAVLQAADQVAELINNEKSRGATTGAGGDPTLGKTTGRSATLTQSQLDGLVAQIKGCMSVPPGAAEAGITAQLHFNIDAAGNVTAMPDVISGGQTQLGSADAARRRLCGADGIGSRKGADQALLELFVHFAVSRHRLVGIGGMLVMRCRVEFLSHRVPPWPG